MYMYMYVYMYMYMFMNVITIINKCDCMNKAVADLGPGLDGSWPPSEVSSEI